MNEKQLLQKLNSMDSLKRYGRITRVVGLMIESKGPKVSLGDLCYIHIQSQNPKTILAEVVGFNEENILLMPFTSINEITVGSLVEGTGASLEIKVGKSLIGSVLNGIGQPLNGSEVPKGLDTVQIDNEPPNPLLRPRISQPIESGVKAIDSLLTVGLGQRIGIFAGSGVGKSTLLGMVARNSSADLNIIALIGERGREVKEFIEKDLGEEGLKKSIVIAVTSDQPALLRIKGAITATAIAEYFRDQGLNVMFMMDSVTRVAMAQREIGLAVGEPPTTKGYTPSVFSLLPKLLERTGPNIKGSITAFYTVLVDGDDMDEPIADTVRGILDGHLVLDRELANKGHYPAINILKSVSRIMNEIVSHHHLEAAKQLRENLAVYTESEDLISIGAYKTGSSQKIDQAVTLYPKISQFLQQSTSEIYPIKESIEQLTNLFRKGVS